MYFVDTAVCRNSPPYLASDTWLSFTSLLCSAVENQFFQKKFKASCPTQEREVGVACSWFRLPAWLGVCILNVAYVDQGESVTGQDTHSNTQTGVSSRMTARTSWYLLSSWKPSLHKRADILKYESQRWIPLQTCSRFFTVRIIVSVLVEANHLDWRYTTLPASRYELSGRYQEPHTRIFNRLVSNWALRVFSAPT